MEKHIQEKHIQKLCPTTAGTVSEASTDAASKEINEIFLVQKPCPAAAGSISFSSVDAEKKSYRVSPLELTSSSLHPFCVRQSRSVSRSSALQLLVLSVCVVHTKAAKKQMSKSTSRSSAL